MKIKKRNFLKNKKIKEIKKEFPEYQELIPNKSKVELIKIEDFPDIYLINDEPLLMNKDDTIIPTLKGAMKMDISKMYATVDMGAINFVIKGADIMSPGIVDAYTELNKGDIVVVNEESHKKPIAVGKCLISGQEMIDNNKGKAIKNLHYVGDSIWELEI